MLTPLPTLAPSPLLCDSWYHHREETTFLNIIGSPLSAKPSNSSHLLHLSNCSFSMPFIASLPLCFVFSPEIQFLNPSVLLNISSHLRLYPIGTSNSPSLHPVLIVKPTGFFHQHTFLPVSEIWVFPLSTPSSVSHTFDQLIGIVMFPLTSVSHISCVSFCSSCQSPASEISASSQSCLLNVIDVWRMEFSCSLNQRHRDDYFLHSSHLTMDI